MSCRRFVPPWYFHQRFGGIHTCNYLLPFTAYRPVNKAVASWWIYTTGAILYIIAENTISRSFVMNNVTIDSTSCHNCTCAHTQKWLNVAHTGFLPRWKYRSLWRINKNVKLNAKEGSHQLIWTRGHRVMRPGCGLVLPPKKPGTSGTLTAFS